jgi:hypothetical protein
MRRVVRINSHFYTDDEIRREILCRTSDMDSVVSIKELAPDGDTRRFEVIWTPH